MASLRKQRGFAMILVMVVVAMGSTWMVLTRLNAATTEISIAKRAHNAKVMARAKETLIGYVAAQANKAGENNPGNLPCPENPGDFYNSDPQYEWRQGLVGTGCGSSVKVGRFPWRTLGLEKLVDADGEALWYVVSPNWGGSSTVINSDSAGQLTVDGVANAAIALIIAPGAAISVQAATGCTAVNQARPTNATPDWRNYLECENATSPADYAFVTTGPSGSFNDQVMVLTAAEMLPPLEASIANRIEREIAPALTTMYSAASWGLTGSNPVLPFAAPFANPGPGTGTANYRGAAGTYAGLLPVNQTQGCTVSASDPRCTTTFLAYSKGLSDIQTGGSGSIRTQSTCGWTSDTYICTGEYLQPTISVAFIINVTNVAMGLRKLDTSKISFTALNDTTGGLGTQNIDHTTTAYLQANGSVYLVIASNGTLPDVAGSGWGTYANYRVSIERAAIGDHDIVATPSTANDLNWFVRNGWHRMTYYAVSSRHTAAILSSERSCTTGTNCLTISSTDPVRPITTNAARAVLVLAGRSLNANARPSSALTDYLEAGNATGSYVRRPIQNRVSFNDRVVVISSN